MTTYSSRSDVSLAVFRAVGFGHAVEIGGRVPKCGIRRAGVPGDSLRLGGLPRQDQGQEEDEEHSRCQRHPTGGAMLKRG